MFKYWLTALFTWFLIINRIRGVLEHSGMPSRRRKEQIRTVLLSPVSSFFIIPRNANYHCEHHRYMKVPWYHLPAFHKILKDMKPEIQAHYSHGVVRGLKEVVSLQSSG